MRYLLCFLLLFTSNGNAVNSPMFIREGTSFSGINYEKNFVRNPEAEKNINNVTISAAILTRTTVTPIQGVASFLIDATASGQTVKFDTSSGDDFLKGQNCEAKFIFTGDASLYIAYVEQGSNKLTGNVTLTNESNSRSVSLNFPCGTVFTNLRLVIESTSASAAPIEVDKVYLGLATNISDSLVDTPWIDESTLFVLQGSGTAGTPTYSTRRVWTRRNGPNLEVAFDFILSGGGGAAGDIQMVLPSKYTMSSTGPAQSVLPLGWAEIIRNGESFYGHANVINRVGTSTVQFGTRRLDTGVTYSFTWVSGDVLRGRLIVPIDQFSNSQTIKINQTPWFIDARLDGSNQSLGVVNVAAFTEITNAGWTLTPVTGSAPVGVMCSGTNPAATPSTTATTCSAGSESVGINFEIPYPGNYEVCFSGSTYYEYDNGEVILNNFQLVETPTNAQTITQSSNVYSHTGGGPGGTATITAASSRMDYTNCANFNFSSAGIKGIRLMYNQTVAGTPNNSIFLASATDKRPKFSVKQLSVPYPMPLIVGSVSSNSTGAERIERAKINCDASSSIISQSNWISAIGNRSGTACSITILSSVFSAEPACTLTVEGTSTHPTAIDTTSATSLTAYGPNADYDANLICMGPK